MAETMTLKKIAGQLGVSYSTVSLAISGSPKVNQQTRKTVLELADSLGYRPNLNARSLKQKKSGFIGVIFPDFSQTYYRELMRDIYPALKERGYTGLFFTIDDNEDFSGIVSEIQGRGVEGVISGAHDHSPLMPLYKLGIPVVAYRRTAGVPFSYVDVDREKGAYMAGAHFAELGYKRMAYLGSHFGGCEPRLIGFKAALSDNGLDLPDQYIVDGQGMEGGFTGMQKLLELPEPPRAVFAFNDSTAIGAMRAIQMRGLRIPQDIALIGFDNILECRYMTPALSTVAQPRQATAENLVNMLCETIASKSAGMRHVVLEPELIIRESCGARAQLNNK